MDVLWNSLGIFCICLSVCMIIVSLYTILKERKQIRHLLAPGEKIPPWYTNATFRKYSEFLCNGVLLIAATTDLYLFQKHVTSAILWSSFLFFLFSGSRFAFTFLEEGVYRTVARETREGISRWPRRFGFHEGIAIALLLLGMSIFTLFNGLVAIKVQTFETTDRAVWFGVSLILLAGLYWLSVRAMQEVKKRRARVSSSSSQSLL